MSATIFVWRPHTTGKETTVGHASMSLSDGSYISWWPLEGDKLRMLNTQGLSQGMRADKREEGRIPDYASPSIDGLDEKAISKWWEEISGRKPGDYSSSRHEIRIAVGRFQLFSGANCSNMVVRGLMVGGLSEKSPLAATIIAKNVVMTPLTMIDVAQAMTGDFSNKVAAAVRSASPTVACLRTLIQYVVLPSSE